MALSEEQKQTVAAWVAAGDNLSAIQKKISEQFKVSMTYMDVRFLVDDLNLKLKDAVQSVPPEIGKAGADGAARGQEKKGFLDKAKEKLGLAREPGDEDLPADDEEDFDEETEGALPAGPSRVTVSVDKVTLNPGAVASGTVAFGDGVTGKWIVDNYGRPGITELSRPGYRPSAADAQAFMQQLGAALQKRGF